MKVAMIGTGGFARAHLSVLAGEPSVEVVGHVSRSRERGEEAARRWGGRAYASPTELLEREEVDAAWIVVPPGAHGPPEEALVERGIPFFVEKPLAADRATAEEVGAAVADRGLVAAVGYNWRAMDTMEEVRRALEATPAHLVLGAWHGSTPPPAWWHRQETGGGQMVEQATHLLDLARHLLGEATVTAATADRHPRPAFPDMDVADTSTALLRFAGGATGVVNATCLLDGPEEVYLKLVCDGLLITITREGATFEAGRERRHVRVGSSPIAREDRAFLEAVRTGDPELLYCSYADALRTHRLAMEVREAAEGTEHA